ncbi:cytosolic purine 5-nucleotidase [Planoprotostelium fungivorum]|uniref:Cytosolic purine 5-nucleotidase n=1 Tax=Planoprotostelium fungivorum TaxID=1890364 RepID=A0A2P6NLZ1_9EUKA|nr:cytosolic purine 5-nucleotidase [Planoprotostelium fungivorum]
MRTDLEEQVQAFLSIHDEKLVDPREPVDRIFVNHDLRMDCIKYIGFDMDHTLTRYTREYEVEMYDLMRHHLVEEGYDEKIKSLRYDLNFAIRGLYFDQETGNLIKVDGADKILCCFYGRRELSRSEILKSYTSMAIPDHAEGGRFYFLKNIQQLPQACLMADLIELFYNGRYEGDLPSIRNIFDDVLKAYYWAHGGPLQDAISKDKERFIGNDKHKTAEMLDRLMKGGIKVFLMTNSYWPFVNDIMRYLLDGQLKDRSSWLEYFDFVIEDAGKPGFFQKGDFNMRELDIKTGKLLPGDIKTLQRHHVYHAGSVQQFYQLTGIKHANTVLYVGDSITSDVIHSSGREAWRTFLIVPELERDVPVWNSSRDLVKDLQKLYEIKRLMYSSQPLSAESAPDVKEVKRLIHEMNKELREKFGRAFGSVLSSGLKNTEYAKTAMESADLYAYSHVNLANYTTFHHFQASYRDMPHRI